MRRQTMHVWLCVAVVWVALWAAVEAHETGASVPVPTKTTEEKAVVTQEHTGPFVRCRMCGAKVARKSDYVPLHDTSKSVASRPSSLFGDDGEVHTFVNPSRVEMEVVAFKHAIGIESEAFTNKATFFDNYNWRDLRCNSCNRHIGWKFHHDELQQCIHTKIMEAVSAKSQEELKAASAEEMAKKKELVRRELEGKCVTASAGWWTYEVCYKKEVRQYHEEQDGTRPSDWSMGVYVGDDRKPGDTMSPMSSEIAQYFTGGQHCDENGELRSSKVVYQCCKSKPKAPTIDNVEEPSLCTYMITVCVPSLCDKTDKTKKSSTYDYAQIASTCEKEFEHSHEASETPSNFAALRWSTVVSEDSSELEWARNLQIKV
ncbi:hypothetical protein Poli38472_002343 [Pythium oligandrum]|uniref:MRH domain-containing protein n=1 Tax=Pythium oligandrum TaxID=41045 RepID=A0A8K1CJK6_PYTOL|nr:hypothetical protein Poli38472_002343 [Pythium oligandrum]|eukprot:TMW63402.1 hypothetical protein Poli38472_002343 [Pythium oligandrum]